MDLPVIFFNKVMLGLLDCMIFGIITQVATLIKKGQKPSFFADRKTNLGQNPTDLPRVWGSVNEKLGFSGIIISFSRVGRVSPT